MSDRLLKESDVIREIDKRVEELSNDSVFVRKRGYIDVLGIKKHILTIPSADRPQGHYIKGENGEWYCSNCKRIDDKYSVARFCWHCGARMKGEDDDH